MWTSSMMMGGQLPIIRVGSAQGAGSGSTLIINKPTGVQSGDLMVAFAGNPGPLTWTPPSGWTEEIDANGLVVAWKVAGGSEPSNYTFTPSFGASFTKGAIVAYRNAAYDVTGSMIAAGTTIPSINLTKAGSALLACGISASAGILAPTGMTTIESISSGSSLSLSEQLLMPAGATGTRAMRNVSNAIAVLIGIKPN